MRRLHLVIKMEPNTKNKVFRSKQAPNKELILFLDVKMVEERFDQHF